MTICKTPMMYDVRFVKPLSYDVNTNIVTAQQQPQPQQQNNHNCSWVETK